MKFQDDISNMNTYIHTYIRTSRNQYVPHFFKVGGIKIGGGGVGSGGGQVGGSGWWGVRVDVNAMLGVGGDVGYGGCEPRIKSIVQCTKRYCTILRK